MKRIKNMKKLTKVLMAVLMVGIVLTVTMIPSFADVNDTFSTTSTSGWSGNGNQSFSFQTESNGNQYMQIDYQNNNSINYYEAIRDCGTFYNDVVLSFDVKFSSNSKDNIFLRARASGVNDPGIRICKEWGNLSYYSEGVSKSLTNSSISSSTWYTFVIKLSMSNGGSQSITVKQRGSNTVLGHAENVPLNIDVSYVNQFVMGSDGTMCLDNLKIYQPSIQSVNITGESYPSIGSSYVYSAKIVDSNGVEYASPIKWSLKEAVSGISIDEDTGRLTVSSTAGVRRVVIVATEKNNTNKKGYFLVDIEK